ncbi:cytochrome b [Croceicoccus bisphenolivorans]|uniref:cytochrome b n=1 Tax=Croceicoccus bisphenolivorans TaxID=1783232 RepID=UPI00082FBF3F|nr:cytochrome b [Croceicoccus bisphenolivorans]
MKLHNLIRKWAVSYTNAGKYSPIGVWFHWIMAALVLFQLGLGWMMTRRPVGGDKLAAYELHSDIGLSILLLAILRFGWRLFIPDPINDADAPRWQSKAAHLTHYLFYGLFALLPLSGWAMWSAIQPVEPLRLAGIVPIPPMPFHTLSPGWQYRVLDWAEWLHVLGVIGLAALVPLHVGAALKHHFWDRDDTVIGIVPEIRDDPRAPDHRQYNPTGV